jgi:cyclic-di-AMP phosphodiesterase PgpH
MKPIMPKWLRPFSSRQTSNGKRNVSWLQRIKTPTYQTWLIGIGTALILSLLLSPSFELRIKEYRVNDIATKDLKSAYDYLVEDQKSTQEKRLAAEKTVLSVYDYDPGILTGLENRIRSVFKSETSPTMKGDKELLEDEARSEFELSLRTFLSVREWQILNREQFSPPIGDALLKLLSPPLRKGVVNDKDLLDPDASRGLTLRNIESREEKGIIPPITVLDLREAKTRFRAQADALIPQMGKEATQVVLKIADRLIRPNLTFNKDETEDRKAKARESVTPVYFQVKRGEMILRAGDRVREDHLLKINTLREAQKKGQVLSVIIGLLILTVVVLVSLYQFSTKNIRKFVLSQKDLLLVSTTLIGTIGLFRLFQLLTDILGGQFLSIPSSSYQFLFPIATGAMLIRIVLNSEVAIVYSLLAGYFSSVLMGNQLFLFVFALTGSIVGAHKVAQCEQRNVIVKAGLIVGGVNVLTILAYHLMSGMSSPMILLSDLVMGFLGGILASVLVLGITPIVESLFRYTTDIKLLELANMDNPLIKDLILQAPGTYHHSVIVGSLVEAAAKSVSANPLLSRVSAYYHDIGKLKKPLYFIENSGSAESKHDNLTPKMSSLVLLSHVKDGIELAREHRLGQRLAHIIQQHHGTSLISYFYKKAKDQEDPEMNSSKEEDFRYPGPKPQTKEAGLVMLADEVEAASRTLSDPTPSRIKNLVQKIISGVFLDGQLEECELTLKDLHKIEESFIRVLNGFFHQRIDYPAAPEGDSLKKKSDEDLDSKPAKTYPLRLKKTKDSPPKDIDRTGTS